MLARILLISASLMIASSVAPPAFAIDITLTGDWSTTIDSDDLISGAGSDLNPTYESPSDQVLVDITNTMGGGDSWRVDVHKSDVVWNSDITVYAHRTSNGTGGSVSGGTSYLQITVSDQTFFTGTDDVADIGLQYKIDGISIDINPNTYTTTIVYTVVDT